MILKRFFGELPEFPVGSTFESRKDLSIARVHCPPISGISGSSKEGADSIVLSGGYEDDEDFGDRIIYTGHGGREGYSKKQTKDQELLLQNKALELSMIKGLPVRVIRGCNHNSQFSPKKGYRYDGLFKVVKVWDEIGKSGFKVWKFELIKI